MLDLTVDRLNLQIAYVAGHEHRLRPITTRAIDLLMERVEARWSVDGPAPRVGMIRRLSVPAVDLNLRGMSDEQAASAIADAMFAALMVKLDV